jgi:glycosyltransferase involved in cell wall biosynthesis
VTGSTVIDVNFCAKYAHNTGIQRVVREIMPHVVDLATAPVELVAWTTRSGAMRSLSSLERRRVLEWRALSSGAAAKELPTTSADAREELVVPWHSRVFMPEVPEPGLCERLACLAEYSGNSVSLIGYDTIPIGSAQLLDSLESERFAHYLTVVKHSDVVVAISESVAREFRGFVSGLAAQGISGPEVVSVSLATEVPARPAVTPDADASALPTAKPLIVCVGSHEPRKNQDAVLFAVERLLSRGSDFRVVFVGGGSRTRTLSFDRRLAQLRAEHGWDIESVRGLGDADLWRLLASARFSVFVSLHEGYGLPVVESLALGTPVLTSNYGSLAEIAARGGCVTVDPRNDGEILRELEAMLMDDELIARLKRESSKLPGRPWSEYARELCAIALPGLIT